MSEDQKVDGGRREAEHGKVDHKESSDDKEVVLSSHKKGAGAPDPLGADIRDAPETSDTQRDEWLFRTEPLQGARPRWDEDGRPQVGFDQTGGVDIGAAGGAVGWSVEQRGAPTLMLPPEQQILQEEEMRMPPRREAHGHGSHRATEHQLPPGHEWFPEFLRTSEPGTSVRTDGVVVGHQGTC